MLYFCLAVFALLFAIAVRYLKLSLSKRKGTEEENVVLTGTTNLNER